MVVRLAIVSPFIDAFKFEYLRTMLASSIKNYVDDLIM